MTSIQESKLLILRKVTLILQKSLQKTLTTYIAVSFACDSYFPRNWLASSVKTANTAKVTPELKEIDFERPRQLFLPLSRGYIQSRAAEQEYRGLVASHLTFPEVT